MNNFDIKWFLLLVIATTFIALLAIVVFYASLKKYESGNNIAMKE